MFIVAAVLGLMTSAGALQGEAYAQQSEIEVTAVGSLRDNNTLLLEGASDVDVFTIGNNTYAAVASQTDDGLQIVNVTNPSTPDAVGQLLDRGDDLSLNVARGVDIFTIGSNTYAAVVAQLDGLQIVDVTNPAAPSPAGSLNSTSLISGPFSVAVFDVDLRTYAAVTSGDSGLQIVNVTDPHNPAVSGQLDDTGSLRLDDSRYVDIFRAGDNTYAAVASNDDNGLQIVNVTDPDNPTPAGNLGDNGSRLLDRAVGVDVFMIGSNTYAAVSSNREHGLQIVNVTDPDNPTPAGNLGDGDSTLLRAAWGVDTFVIGHGAYAAVISQQEDGLQIVNVTDPDNPTEAGQLKDTPDLLLDGARAVDVFAIGTTIYAVVAAIDDRGIQLVRLGAEAETPNEPPVAPAEMAITLEDTPIAITPNISDPDTSDTPAISTVSDPPNGTATHDDTTIIYTPDQDYDGTDTFSYTVTDGTDTTQGTVTVTVVRGNNDPVLGTIGDRAATVGVQLTITPTVTDADTTDTHTYSITRGTLPAAAVFSTSDGSITWTPVQADAGQTHEVTITVNDGRGGTDSETFDIVAAEVDTTPLISATPAGQLRDGGPRLLTTATSLDVFTIGDKTYAAVASYGDDALQIINVTDPDSPSAAGHLADTNSLRLDGAYGVDVFTIGDKTYAAVASHGDDALQIVNVTDSDNPEASGSVEDTEPAGGIDDELLLEKSRGVAVFVIGDKTYAAVTSSRDRGLQIINVTDPDNPAPAGQLKDTAGAGGLLLAGPWGVDVFTVGGSTYAAVASFADNGLQIVNVTDPRNPAPAGQLKDTAGAGGLLLAGSVGVDTFTTAHGTYVAVASEKDNGLQIVNVTDPRNPAPAGHLADTEPASDGDDELLLEKSRGVAVFVMGDNTYATVTSFADNGLQIVDVTDPDNPAPAGQLKDTAGGGELLLDRAFGVDIFAVGGNTYAAVASRADNGIQIARLSDITPPAFASAALDEGTGTMTITFSETIDVSETDLSMLYVSDTGGIDEVALTGAAFDSNAADSATISLTLTQAHLNRIIQMGTPQLDIGAAAVYDLFVNHIGAVPDNPITVTADTVRPTFASAALGESTGTMTITFSKTIDVSETDLSMLYVSDTGGIDEVALTGAAFDSNAADSATISLTLTQSHLNQIAPMVTPQLDIKTGAVLDLAGNDIDTASDNPIDITKPEFISARLGSLEDTSSTELEGASGVAVFTVDTNTYAAVASYDDDGLQIVDVSDPDNPAAAGSLGDDTTRLLEGASGVAVFTVDTNTYAAVVSEIDDGLQIVDVSDPDNPAAAGSLGDDTTRLLEGASGVAVFTVDTNTYAAVASFTDNGLQIVDVSDPDNPAAAGSLGDDTTRLLEGAYTADVFTIGTSTYIAVVSEIDDGLQIVDVSDPDNPAAAGSLGDDTTRLLEGASGVAVFTVDTNTYAAVASFTDNGLQIVDVSDPDNPAAAGSLGDDTTRLLEGASGVAVFTIGTNTYVAVASETDDGLQIVDVSDPANPTDAGSLGDTSDLLLDGAYAADVFTIGSNTYAAVASYDDHGIQLVRLGAEAETPNNPPVAPDDAATTPEDTAVIITPAISDPDVADTPRISAVDDPPNGAATHDDTTITYTPDTDYEGTDTFEYTISDGTDTAQGTITVTVTRDNNDPVLGTIGDRAATVGVQLTITPTITDDDTTDTHTYSISRGTLPAAAVFSTSDGTLVWTPVPADAGQTHTVTITVNDGRGGTDSETFDIAVGDAPPTLTLTPVGNIGDNPQLLLDGAHDVDTFQIGTNTYAAVVSESDNGLQIIDVTDPDNPTAAGSLGDTSDELLLVGARGVDIFKIGTNTYAAVASNHDDGIQIVNVTDPDNLTAAGSLKDDGSKLLDGAVSVSVFKIGGSTYAAVASHNEHGIQIVNVTDPDNPAAAGSLGDGTQTILNGPRSVDVFMIGGSTYAAVAAESNSNNGLQIVDVTDPDNPAAAGNLGDDTSTLLLGARGVDTFQIGTNTYAAVASNREHGLQIVDVTDPDNPAAAGNLGDDTSTLLRNARGVDTFQIGANTYAAVTSNNEDGLQIVDVTDPDSPTAAGSLGDDGTGGTLLLDGAGSVAVFKIGANTYAAVTSNSDDGLQLVRLDEAAETPNAPPVAPAATATTAEDTPVTITPAISDPDTSDTPTISAVENPPNGTTIHDGTTITYTPDADYEGTDTFGYTVSDGTDTAQGTITVTVTPDNNAPVLGTIGDQTATPGTQLTITPSVTDADPTDTHTYSISRGTLPAAAAFTTSDGRIAWTPVQADAGQTHTVTITVNDGRGGTDSETFDIAVAAGGDTTPPVITVTGADPLVHELGDTFVDPGATADDGSAVTADDSAVDFGNAGTYTITYMATDNDGNKGTATRDITIQDTTAPTITPNGKSSVAVVLGGTYTEQGATVSDNDPDYAGTVSIGGDTVDVSTAGIYVVTYTATADDAGNAPDAAERTVTVLDQSELTIALLENPAAAGQLEDTEGPGQLLLEHTRGVETFVTGGKTYAVVASFGDGGLQIVDVSDPDSPEAAGQLADTNSLLLGGASDVDIFAINARTYAAVTSITDGGLQIVDVTNPAGPSATGLLEDTLGGGIDLLLDDTTSVDTFTITDGTDDRTYAVVTSDNDGGLQIVNVTDPENPDAVGQVRDNGSRLLANTAGVAIFEADARTYAAVTSGSDGGLQIVNVTDPENPDAVGMLRDDNARLLGGTSGVAIFEADARTYAAVTSRGDGGLQIVDVTDPTAPSAAGQLRDDNARLLDDTIDVDIFTAGGRTYAAVTAVTDDAFDGLQIVDVTNPANPRDAGKLPNSSILLLHGASGVDTFVIGTSTYAAVTSGEDGGLQIAELAAADITAPAFSSATLDETTGMMSITFDETIDVSATDLSKLYVSDTGASDEVAMTDATFDDAVPDSETIQLVLTTAQLALVVPMDAPQLDIAAGAVSDPAGNAIGDEPDRAIVLAGANVAPVAPDVHVSAYKNTPVTIDPAMSDPDAADTPRISAVDDPPNGAVTHDDTAITYTPDTDYAGLDSFAYTVTDGTDTARGTVTVYVSLDLLKSPAAAGSLEDTDDEMTEGIITEEGLLLDNTRAVDTFRIGAGTYAAVVSFEDDGLQVVSMTDPAAPAPAGQLKDDESLLLDGAYDVAVFTIGGSTYAAVASNVDNGLQIVDISDPDNPAPAGNLEDVEEPDELFLHGATAVDTFVINGNTYAAVVSEHDGGLQIVDISDPDNPAPAGRLEDTAGMRLTRLVAVDTFVISDNTYAAVASYENNGLKIIDVTDPDNPEPAGQLRDDGDASLLLSTSFGIDTFTINGNTYAAVTSRSEGGLQIIDVTDPHNPAPAGRLTDDPSLLLRFTHGVDTFVLGNHTYAAVTSRGEDGLQIVDVSDPASPEDVGGLKDMSSLLLNDATGVKTFVAGNHTYAAVTSEKDGGLQTVRLSDIDTTPPVITVTGANPLTHELGDPYTDPGATTVDGSPVTADVSAVDTDTEGDYTVTYTATDPNGNEASDARTVQVRDTTPPVITLTGGDVTVELGGTYAEQGATVSDNDPAYAETVNADFSAVDTSLAGSYIVTYTASPDGANNTPDPVERRVTVQDTTNPVIAISGDSPLLHELGSPYSDPGATVTDNDPAYAGTVSIGGDAVNVDVTGTYVVTYTASPDGANNTPDPVERRVTVQDTTNPVIAISGDSPLLHELGSPYSDPGATVTDNDPAYAGTVATDDTAVNVNESGSYIVTYTASPDGANNTPDPVERRVTVQDTTKPVITVNGPPSLTLQLGSPYTEQGATVTDNDPAYAGTVSIGGDTVNVDVTGTYVVTYTASPDGAGLAPDPAERIVIVQDTAAPVITISGDSPLAHELGTAYDDPGATADDGSAVVTDDTAVDVTRRGDYHVTYTATDGEGNTGTAIRIVHVRDTLPPVITVSGDDPVTVELGDLYADAGATATDNDPAYDGTVTADTSAIDTGQAGTYTVTYAAADDGGNEATATRIVMIRDTTPPVITVSGDDPAVVELGGTYADAGATSTDNDPDYTDTVMTDTSAVDTGIAGNYTVTYAAADDGGNEATATRVVTVRDTTPPVIMPSGDDPFVSELGVPYVDPGAVVTDNDPAYRGTVSVDSAAVDTGTVGDYVVTYTASADAAGLAPDPVTRQVHVRDTSPPAFESATLDENTGAMTITFSKAVDVSATGLTLLHVSDVNQADMVPLAGAIFDFDSADVETLSLTLADSQMEQVIPMDMPQLDIAADAVSDLRGNLIDASPDNPITLTERVQVREDDGAGTGRINSGGGGGGGGGRTNVITSSAGVDLAYIASISWDCTAGLVTITAGPVSDDLSISIRTTESSVTKVTATGQTVGGLLAFTGPISQSETYIGVSAILQSGGGLSSDYESVNVDACVGQRTYDIPASLSVDIDTVGQPSDAIDEPQPPVPEPEPVVQPEPEPQPPVPEPEPVVQPEPEPQPPVPEPEPVVQPEPEPQPPVPEPEPVVQPEPTPAPMPGGSCLIATAAYGTEMASQVQALREIRDGALLSTDSGASFVAGFNSVYYMFSPAVADLERQSPAFREAVRIVISPMISTLSIMSLAEEGSESSVLALGASVIALNVGMYVAAPAAAIVAARRLHAQAK